MTAPARRRRPAKEKKHWVFINPSVAELVKKIGEAGPNPRLEAHLDGTDMTFVISGSDYSGTAYSGTVNDSHLCPGPNCPPRT